MDTKEIFRGISQKMMQDFESISSQIHHSGSKGEVREAILKKFLEDYLPKKYSLSSGEVIDREGNVSNQCDIVIYDASNCPLILNQGDFNVFPCEPVLATIEVKSILDLSEIRDCLKKTKSIKNLKRPLGYIGSIVFVYKTVYSENPLDKISKILLEEYENIEPHEYIDMICVLDKGVIALSNPSNVL